MEPSLLVVVARTSDVLMATEPPAPPTTITVGTEVVMVLPAESVVVTGTVVLTELPSEAVVVVVAVAPDAFVPWMAESVG